MDLERELIVLIENVLLSALIVNFLSDFCRGQRRPVIFIASLNQPILTSQL